MRKLRVGLIGAGFMGKAHSLAYAAMPMFFWPAPAIAERYIVADISEESASEAALRFGFEHSTGNWRDVINDESVDVVDIATPNNTHAEIAIAAAQAGKHIICEKPLARTLAEAKTMVEAVKNSNVVHMVAFNYRRTPAVALARKLIDEGAIGKIINFRGTYLQDWSADPNSPLSWRFQKAIAGSGALGDIGSHVIDFARYLVGEIVSVNALMKTYIKERPIQQGTLDKLGAASAVTNTKKAPVDVDDEVVALLRFENGAIGSLEVTRNAQGRNNFLGFEIHGETGSLVFNYERRDELQFFSKNDLIDRRGFRTIYTGPVHPYGDGLWPIPALGIGYGETKIIEIYDFFKAIVEGGSVSPNFFDGYQVACIEEAIARSAESELWTDVQRIAV